MVTQGCWGMMGIVEELKHQPPAPLLPESSLDGLCEVPGTLPCGQVTRSRECGGSWAVSTGLLRGPWLSSRSPGGLEELPTHTAILLGAAFILHLWLLRQPRCVRGHALL